MRVVLSPGRRGPDGARARVPCRMDRTKEAQDMLRHVAWVIAVTVAVQATAAQKRGGKKVFEVDRVETSAGELVITFIGHGTLMFGFAGKTIHVDPVSREADYTGLAKADLVLVTHEHGDHLDPGAVKQCSTPRTQIVANAASAGKLPGAIVMKNGDSKTVAGLKILAVPAYNIRHMRAPGRPFHPRGVGNGYIISFADTRVYVAGDTEDVPEIMGLSGIDIAFLPMNLPYTMTPEMVAKAAKAFRPKILYPYHFGSTDTAKLTRLLAAEKGIDVRVRKLQ